MSKTITQEAVIAECMRDQFGDPLVNNSFRGLLVEGMVGLELRETGFVRKSRWAGWDLERASDGICIEVRQKALWQNWDNEQNAPQQTDLLGTRLIVPQSPIWSAGCRRSVG